MRKEISLAIVVMLLIVSCQKNDDVETIEAIEQLNQTRVASTTSTAPLQKEAFESMLQWTAYMSAQAILHNTEAENQFVDVLQNDTTSPYKIIDLNDLLGHDIEDLSFKSAFREQFFRFVSLDCDKGDNNEGGFGPIAGGPIEEPEIDIADPEDCDGALTNFIAALIDYHCLEIYLPLGYDESNNEITSTSHPLTTQMQNDCYLHPHDNNTLTIIKANNLNQYNNPLVVRPKRAEVLNSDCQYLDYAGIDFTLFLDN